MEKNKIALVTVMSTEDWSQEEKLAKINREIREVQGKEFVDFVVIDLCASRTNREIAGKVASHVISLPVNSGMGAAIRAGVKCIETKTHDQVIIFDAERNLSPEQFSQVTKSLDNHDLVVGSSFHPNSDKTKVSAEQALKNEYVLAPVIKTTGLKHLTDVRSAIIGLHLSDLSELAPDLIGTSASFYQELLLRYSKKIRNLTVDEIPCSAKEEGIVPFAPGKRDSVENMYEAFRLVMNSIQEQLEIPNRSIAAAR